MVGHRGQTVRESPEERRASPRHQDIVEVRLDVLDHVIPQAAPDVASLVVALLNVALAIRREPSVPRVRTVRTVPSEESA